MPRGDGTGPAGMGPMTGRAAGLCAGFDRPGYMNPYQRRGFGFGGGLGRGLGRGFGRGMGWRARMAMFGEMPSAPAAQAYGSAGATPPAYNYPSGPDPEDEREMLQQQADHLKQQLQNVEQRLEALKEEKETKSQEE